MTLKKSMLACVERFKNLGFFFFFKVGIMIDIAEHHCLMPV